jgi:hypothetical protein
MRAFKLIVLAILLAAAVIIAAAIIYGRRAPALQADSAFNFKKGRLWASIDGRAAALIDSGTSMSIFPKDWTALGEVEGSEGVSTPFGERRLSVRRIRPSKIGGIPFKGTVLAGDVPYPIIGNDFIFSRNNVLFTRDGLEFDVASGAEDAAACVGLLIGYQGHATNSAVASIHLLLEIDGSEQKVYFDTGIPSALTASASAPEPTKKLFPRLDVRHNTLGEWALAPYFSRQASLGFGDKSRSVPYRHYYMDKKGRAPFVMGAGILQDYSILIDHQKGRACFLDAG